VQNFHAIVSFHNEGELGPNEGELGASHYAGEDSVSELMERAHETIHEHTPHGDPWAKRVALLVSVLAAVLALAGIGEKSSQNAYLTDHVALSDTWAFYQAKNVRSVVRTSEANVMASQPNAQDPKVAAAINDARQYAAQMRDDPKGGEGMKQLVVKAKDMEAERDEAFHRYHHYEIAVGGLEIAIVLASVSVVTGMRALTYAAAVAGSTAAVWSLAVAMRWF
jgi:hypothetical protein